VLGNYQITYNTADFTIDKKTASVTPNAKSKTYGDVDPALTGTLTGFLAADGVTATYSRAPGEMVVGSPYTISATLSPAGVLGNYQITYNTADFTIDKKTASVTPNAKSKTYGDADPALTGTLTGFLAADGVTATYSRALGETVLGGPYHITATLAPADVLSNYDITNAGASFTINTRPATWTTNPNSKTYGDGDSNPLTSGSGSGFVAGDNVTATYGRAAGETVTGGPYHITATLSPSGVLLNYSITNAGASFTINPRPAAVAADAKTKTYGDPNPALTVTVTGTVNGDVLDYTLATTALQFSNVGDYVITVTLGSNPNYNVTSTNGTLHTSQKNATVTADNKAKTYGDLNPALTATVVGQVTGGDAVNYGLSTTVVQCSNVGPYPISVTLGSNPNYNVAPTNGTLTINKKHLTVTADNKSKVYNAAPFTNFTATITGFTCGDTVAVVSGSATYTGSAVGATLPGTYTITANVGTLSATNYDFPGPSPGTYFVNGTLAIGYGTCTGSNPGHVILPPINSDGTSVYKRQGGSTIPVKFTVCDANGNPISDPNAVFAGTGGQLTMLSDVRGQVENINEVGGTDIPDAAFRWSSGIWIFNMASNNLQAGHQYTFRINLKDGSGIQFVVGIK
jgi:hypothetical protein